MSFWFTVIGTLVYFRVADWVFTNDLRRIPKALRTAVIILALPGAVYNDFVDKGADAFWDKIAEIKTRRYNRARA